MNSEKGNRVSAAGGGGGHPLWFLEHQKGLVGMELRSDHTNFDHTVYLIPFKAGAPFEAILVIFDRRTLIFFV